MTKNTPTTNDSKTPNTDTLSLGASSVSTIILLGVTGPHTDVADSTQIPTSVL